MPHCCLSHEQARRRSDEFEHTVLSCPQDVMQGWCHVQCLACLCFECQQHLHLLANLMAHWVEGCMQALLSESRGAHARETSHLSAERDAMAGQLTAQHAQCRQREAELEALRQDMASAVEGALQSP